MGKTSHKPNVKSMTGFARVSFGDPAIELDVEIKSVNHRFLEVVLKAPRCYAALERDVKSAIQQLHKRGRIEVSVVRRVRSDSPLAAEEFSPSFDAAVKRYTAACKRFGAGSVALSEFMGQLILRESEGEAENLIPSEEEVGHLLRLVSEASQALAVMRESEGAGLGADISHRVGTIESLRSQIGDLMEGAPKRLRERLDERLKAIAPEVKADAERLALEVALLADKVDVAEELARLDIHLVQFRNTLAGHVDGVGRKLDFMTQEIGRELNTIGSKAQDAKVQGLVVDAKAELERIREQVQNVE